MFSTRLTVDLIFRNLASNNISIHFLVFVSVFFIVFGMCVICSCFSKIERRQQTQQQTVEGGEETTTTCIVPTVDVTPASTTDRPSIPVIRNNTVAPLSFDDLDQL